MKYEIKNSIMMRICMVITAACILIFLYIVYEKYGMNGWISNEAAVAARRVNIVQADADRTEKLPDSPVVSAHTAVLIEGVSGRILYEKSKDIQMYPASTTKIMTALLAVDSAEDAEIKETAESETEEFLAKRVRAADEAVGAEGSSIYLKKDEFYYV